MPFHAIAVLSGDRQKTIPNRSDGEMLSEVVLPFVASGVITLKWGSKTQSYQVLELRIYETKTAWDKRKGPIGDLLKGKKNQYSRFAVKAEELLATNKPKVFVVMPIQGEKHGDQEQQRVYREYDERFEAIESVVAEAGGIAIRIDKEHPLEDLVARIKKEIRAPHRGRARFLSIGYDRVVPVTYLDQAATNSPAPPWQSCCPRETLVPPWCPDTNRRSVAHASRVQSPRMAHPVDDPVCNAVLAELGAAALAPVRASRSHARVLAAAPCLRRERAGAGNKKPGRCSPSGSVICSSIEC